MAEIENGRSRNWSKSKLVELEKKKKPAEVEIGRSRPRSTPDPPSPPSDPPSLRWTARNFALCFPLFEKTYGLNPSPKRLRHNANPTWGHPQTVPRGRAFLHQCDTNKRFAEANQGRNEGDNARDGRHSRPTSFPHEGHRELHVRRWVSTRSAGSALLPRSEHDERASPAKTRKSEMVAEDGKKARNFGHGRLWPIQFWPIHFWPTFWANPFCVCCVCVLCVLCVCVLCVCVCVVCVVVFVGVAVLWWCGGVSRYSWVCPRFGCSLGPPHPDPPLPVTRLHTTA